MKLSTENLYQALSLKLDCLDSDDIAIDITSNDRVRVLTSPTFVLNARELLVQYKVSPLDDEGICRLANSYTQESRNLIPLREGS